MKISTFDPREFLRRSGYTLLEAMLSTSVLSMAFVAFAFTVSQGGRISQLADGKLTYTKDAQLLMSAILPNIREAKDIEIGLWDGTTFNRITNQVPRVAHAIRVFATTNRNTFTVFYLDPADDTLKSFINGAAIPSRLMGSVTNTAPFTFEDFRGNVVTNDPSNYVVGVHLELKDIVYGATQDDGSDSFDNFRLTTKVTRRMVE